MVPASWQVTSTTGRNRPGAAIDGICDYNPDARRALLRTCRRSLQMVLRLLAHNAEHWPSRHLKGYLCDDDEYRAITRETLIRDLPGVITYSPDAIIASVRHAARSPAGLDVGRIVPPVLPVRRRIGHGCLDPAGRRLRRRGHEWRQQLIDGVQHAPRHYLAYRGGVCDVLQRVAIEHR